MSAPNKNWPRWVVASIYKHFNAGKGSYPVYLEGMERAASPANLTEVRVDGPTPVEICKDCWKLTCEINVLISAVLDQKNLYTYQTMIGHFSELFTSNINILKLGSEVDDNGTLIGCMILKSNGNERIQISNFGIIGPEVNLQQGTIEGHYEMLITGD